jgi:hypothetical protein
MRTYLEPSDFPAHAITVNGRTMVKLDDRTVAYLNSDGTLGRLRYFCSPVGVRAYLVGTDPAHALVIGTADPYEMSQLLRLPDFGDTCICAQCGCTEVKFTEPVDAAIPPRAPR